MRGWIPQKRPAILQVNEPYRNCQYHRKDITIIDNRSQDMFEMISLPLYVRWVLFAWGLDRFIAEMSTYEISSFICDKDAEICGHFSGRHQCTGLYKPLINIKRTLISQSPLRSKRYLATVASVASLLTHRVCGCNEIYHLKYLLFVWILYQDFSFL